MAKALELRVHKLTKEFPVEEKYRSADQLRRSSSSVTNNIAEAYWKLSVKEKSYILRSVAMTEAEETRSNLIRCAEKGFLDSTIANAISEDYIELRKAMHGYIRFIKEKFGVSNSSTD